MSTPSKLIKKSLPNGENNVSPLGEYDTLADTDGKRGAQDETRTLWLCIWHALLIVQAGLAKYLKLSRRCKNCGHAL